MLTIQKQPFRQLTEQIIPPPEDARTTVKTNITTSANQYQSRTRARMLAKKVFFGRGNCLKIMLSSKGEFYLHLGKEVKLNFSSEQKPKVEQKLNPDSNSSSTSNASNPNSNVSCAAESAVNNSWSWSKLKLSDIELAEILLVIKGVKQSVSFYHNFNGAAAQLWINRQDIAKDSAKDSTRNDNITGAIFFKTKDKSNDINKQLTLAEAEILRIMIEGSILAMSKIEAQSMQASSRNAL